MKKSTNNNKNNQEGENESGVGHLSCAIGICTGLG